MIRHKFYPPTAPMPKFIETVISDVFEKNQNEIQSESQSESQSKKQSGNSDGVLAQLRQDFEALGFRTEKDKTNAGKIKIPVRSGGNGTTVKTFEVDAYNEAEKTIAEVEAGRAFANNQFLKDFFEAIIIDNIDYLIIAVRNIYRKSKDFEKVIAFFDAMYASSRFNCPLKGLLIIGY